MSEPKLNILVAYPYWRNNMTPLLKSMSNKVRLLIDSGAFTAWKSGKPIDRKDYANFINELPIKPWKYFSLDVIGDAKRTQDNLAWFYANGYKPTPVFQRGEDFKLIPKYAERTGMVGLGLGVGSKGTMNYLREAMKHTKSVNVHWLGIVRPQWITYYKPYSADTASVWGVRRWGAIELFERGKIFSLISPWKKTGPPRSKKKPPKRIYNAIKALGVDPEVFQHRKAWTTDGTSVLVTTRSWVAYCREVEKRLGTKIFFGCGNDKNIKMLKEAWEWCEQNETSF